MSKIIICISGLAIIFYSCKKDNAGSSLLPPVDPGPPVSHTIKINDPDAITAGLNIWHAEKKQGNITTIFNGSAPKLDPDSNQHQLFAVAGGYVGFKPVLQSGTVSGYFFKVKGASSYFNIDFSKPRGERQLNGPLNSASMKEGDEDSLIVLQIPDSIQTGTFCGVYYVWDDNRNVSDSMEICITIVQKGPGAGGQDFIGTWRRFAYNTGDSTHWIYPADSTKYTGGPLYCYNGILSGNSCGVQSGCSTIATHTEYFQFEVLDDYVLFPNGDFVLHDSTVSAFFNFSRSDCSQYAYDYTYYSQTFYGVWGWDETTQKLVIIFETTNRGRANTRFRNFAILNKDDAKMIVSYTDAWNFFYMIDFRKI